MSQKYLDLLGERLQDHPEALEAMCALAERWVEGLMLDSL